MTTQQIEAIRERLYKTYYMPDAISRDEVNGLLDHIDAQQAEIERLRLLLPLAKIADEILNYLCMTISGRWDRHQSHSVYAKGLVGLRNKFRALPPELKAEIRGKQEALAEKEGV